MSAANIFANSPVAEGSRFSSPLVKFAVAGGVAVSVFAAYMLLSGQASGLFNHDTGKPQPPTPQISPVSPPFRPMPPAGADVARPHAASPFHDAYRSNAGGAQPPGVGSSMNAYTAPSRSASSTAGASDVAERDHSKTALEETLTPTKFEATGVTELTHLDYLIEQGRSLPCTQMSFINTTYAGSVTAIIPVAIRGETGDIELLGPGAKIFGTIQHGQSNGVDRAFVLWQNITTSVARDRDGVPHQFRVQVSSPASSDLGETGLDGELNRHLGPKVGAVIGVSLLQGVTQGVASSFQHQGNNSNNGSPSINFNQVEQGANSAGNMLASQFVSIPDILTRQQGKSCSVELVRDLDLSKAYPKLKSLLAMQRRG